MVTAQYIAPDEIRGYMLIETLQQKHAMVMLWKSHLYVLYGAIYVEDYDPDSGQGIDNVAKLLLIDTRYSDARRITEFNRETDDFSKLQGLLWVASEPQ
jgi:predicted NAD/FAD-dependent oxidoreductase